MKRYIYIFAALLLAACAKTEVAYDSPSEIAFAPAAEGMTKAAVEGEEYAADLNFNVFAQTSDGAPYFNNVSFEPGSETSSGLTVYEGNPTQYWPRTKNLVFAGYTGTSYPAAAMKADFTELSITGYQQTVDNDLMYFFDRGEDGDGYNTKSGIVSPVMKHACAWITINITGESACGNWPIDLISIDGISTEGEVTFSESNVGWDGLASNGSWTIYDDGGLISTAPSAEAIVIPQTPGTLTVKYNGKTKDDISLKYNGDALWEAGVHYTYTLDFKNPYKIDFSVSGVTAWDGTTPEITIQ